MNTETRPPPPGALFACVLASITAIAPLALHMFFPAVPDVKAHFGVDEATAELTLSVPLFTMAFMTLAYGSFSDRFGRRPVLLGAIALFVAGSLACALANSIWVLIAGRVLQAAGGAGGIGLARTIARDVYGTEKLVKVIAYLTMAYTLGPMLATPLGGLLIELSGWRALVTTAAGIGAVLALLTWFVMYETHPTGGGGVGTRINPVRDFVTLMGNLRFASFVLQSGFSSGAFFALASANAFLLTEYLHRPASEYGLYFLFFPGGFIVGNFVSSRLSGRVPLEGMVAIGATLLIVTVSTQAAVIAAGIVTPLVLFLPGLFITFAQGLALPNSQSGAIIEAGALAGTGAGIGVFMQMMGPASFTQIYGLIADGTPTPMTITVCTSAAISFAFGIIPFLTRRRASKR